MEAWEDQEVGCTQKILANLLRWEMQMPGSEHTTEPEGAALWIAGAGERGRLTAFLVHIKEDMISVCKIPIKIMFLYCWAVSHNIMCAQGS